MAGRGSSQRNGAIDAEHGKSFHSFNFGRTILSLLILLASVGRPWIFAVACDRQCFSRKGKEPDVLGQGCRNRFARSGLPSYTEIFLSHPFSVSVSLLQGFQAICIACVQSAPCSSLDGFLSKEAGGGHYIK